MPFPSARPSPPQIQSLAAPFGYFGTSRPPVEAGGGKVRLGRRLELAAVRRTGGLHRLCAVPASNWTATFDRNVLAALRVTTRLLPAMRTARWGRVINISSVAATMPPSGGPDYSAAKAAMNAMTGSMAKAVATDGITVNAVSPGTIRSAKLEEAFRSVAADRGIYAADAPWEKVQAGVLPLFAQVPIGRVGELDELANAVAFLASPLAAYITGVNLRVDGGMSPCL